MSNATISFKTIYLETNQGHGNARRKSLSECSNELVALMDADDISLSERFQRQLDLFLRNPALDICGGHITEFVGDESNIIGRREVKLTDALIKKDLKKRCPMNQVSVMFKKFAYDEAGGYADFYCEEDYYLWTRMIQNKAVFANVDEDIVNVRTGEGMSLRRGGMKYFKSERDMQRFLLKNKLISFPRYLYNVGLRFGGEVLLPNSLRNKLFKIVRKDVSDDKNIKTDKEIKTVEIDSVKDYPPFSVSMCVYGKDNPEWFDKALESVIVNQTVKPSEVVLVVDGPIPESIEDVIQKYSEICAGGGYNIPHYKI